MKIKIPWITYLYCLLLFLGGYGMVLFYSILLLCVHDFFHYCMALLLHQRVSCIVIFPFGLSMQVDNIEYGNSLNEILIAMGGPLSIYASSLLLSFLMQFDIISISFYEYLFNININIFLFNILPIYPLDGGRVLHGLCHYVFNYKWAHILCLFLSLVFACVILLWLDLTILYLYIIFLVFQILVRFKNINSIVRKFHFYRYAHPLTTKRKRINKSDVLYRNTQSILVKHNQLEYEYLRFIFMYDIHK